MSRRVERGPAEEGARDRVKLHARDFIWRAHHEYEPSATYVSVMRVCMPEKKS